ncbi:MAG TPA: hypothetical protein QGH03_00330 [Candidatus Paceibacterota bacterium]|jgi:hydroxypyruvate isomerase|nr:hypothetical protein [Parcubacteria group bacterium]HJN62673.1 hypothetical protein [Candidatus Paceibacterota bacterium]|tara:strand:+ start:1674 stop:1925 length:252 start_codon:yes stop_codon:yes gene_type:complete
MKVNRKIVECAEGLLALSSSNSSLEEFRKLIEEAHNHLHALRKRGQDVLAQALTVRITKAEELQKQAEELQKQAEELQKQKRK